jgi:hypothetical protein
MKRFAVSLLAVIILLSTLAPAMGQDRKRSKFGRKARTVAIIGGAATLGALTGGLSLAAMGAGGAGLFAFNRRAARRHFKPSTRRIGTVLSGTALGGGIGGLVGGSKAAAIGAGAGAGGSYLYTRSRHATRRY